MNKRRTFPKFLNIVLVILIAGTIAITPGLQTKVSAATGPTSISAINAGGGTRAAAINAVTDRIYSQDSPATSTTMGGTVWAWGVNGVGNGSYTDSNTPVHVSGLAGIVAIAGGNCFSLALKSDGTVWTWGENGDGELGDGSYTSSNTPVQVSGLAGVTAVAGGDYHSLALKSDGTVWTWGWNVNGQLGDGSYTERNTPVRVSGLAGVISIDGGYLHSLALKSDGTVWAWGDNQAGQLGDGSYTNRNTPVSVSGLAGITAIVGGNLHSLALKSDGTVWTWGRNGYGELGDGSNITRITPVQVSGLAGVIAVAGGEFYSVALKSDGTVWAWGDNYDDELGNGNNNNSKVPVQVSGLAGVTAIAGGSQHSLALKSDGTVWTWGRNQYGQLGDGSYTNRNTPVQVSGLAGVTIIGGGCCHSLALKNNVAPTPIVSSIHISANPAIVFELPGNHSSISASVLDQNGNPMQGIAVNFATTNGNLSTSNVITDINGKAAVNLTPNQSDSAPVPVTVTASTTQGKQATTQITFSPPSATASNWQMSSVFNIGRSEITLGQYLVPSANSYNVFVAQDKKIDINALQNLTVPVFIITKAASADETQFTQALSQYFAMQASSTYDARELVIMEMPYTPAIQTLFNATVQGTITVPLPSFLSLFFENPYLKTTSTGYFNFGFLFSQNNSSIKSFDDFLNAIDTGFEAIRKPDSVCLLDAINLVLDHVGDVSLSVITSDLNQYGLLQSYKLMDLIGIKIALTNTNILYSSVEDYFDVLNYGVQACISGGGNAKADVRFVMTSFKIVFNGLPILVPSLKDNLWYVIVTHGVSVVTTVVDPNGATIVPSYYDASGTLVLGYDPSSENVIYASPSGIYSPIADSYITMLYENSTNSIKYTTVLNAVGGSDPLPYNVQIAGSGQAGGSAGYAGMLPGGSSVSIPVNISSNGNVPQEVCLSPQLTIGQNGNALTVTAKGTLSSGSTVPVSSALIVINGIQSAMNQVDASTFNTTVDTTNIPLPASLAVYMISPTVSGGFAEGIARASTTVTFTTSPKRLSAGSVSSLITVQTQDTSGHAVNATNSTAINLTTTSGSGRFDANATGLFDGTFTSVTIPAGSNSANFYYKDNLGGIPTITAVSEGFNSGTQKETITRATVADFDADGRTDISVYRPSNGLWVVLRSGSSQAAVQQWGIAGDTQVAGDYDGDGKADYAVYRPSNGLWVVLNSGTSQPTIQQWGTSGDTAVPGDYNGDGRTDFAVYRPSNGLWIVLNSGSGTTTIQQWGTAGDIPVPGDYNGDGKTDFAVYRPSNGLWIILNSGTGIPTIQQWGTTGDIPVPGDYNGDGKTDIAVYRPSSGLWIVLNSGTGIPTIQQWGANGDTAVPGDYNGDGKTDMAVYRPSNGLWIILPSGTGTPVIQQWGIPDDVPVP